MGFDRIFLFFWIILLHTPMGNAISFLFLSKIIPIFQLQRLGGLHLYCYFALNQNIVVQ